MSLFRQDLEAFSCDIQIIVYHGKEKNGNTGYLFCKTEYHASLLE